MTYLFDEDKNFFGLDGRLLASGKVYFCVPDGTANINTLKTIYTTHAMGVTASNPQTLTATGRFAQEVHGTGLYDIVIKTSALATVRTLYNVPAQYVIDLAPTAAEISASVTPTDYDYPVGNVLRYGADSTGVADSATAFQNCLNVLGTTGGVMTVPKGTYKIATGLTFPKTPDGFGLRIIGDSPGATKINFTGTGYLFTIGDGDVTYSSFWNTIEDLSMYGNGAVGQSGAVKLNSAYFWRVKNCIIRDFTTASAIGIYGVPAKPVYHGVVEKTQFRNVPRGISFEGTGGVGANSNTVTNCWFGVHSDAGIYLDAVSSNVIGPMNEFNGSTTTAIKLNNACDGNKILYNQFDGPTNQVQFVTDTSQKTQIWGNSGAGVISGVGTTTSVFDPDDGRIYCETGLIVGDANQTDVTSIPLTVVAPASGTNYALLVQKSTGQYLLRTNKDGATELYQNLTTHGQTTLGNDITNNSNVATITNVGAGATNSILILKGATSQSGNAIEIQNVSGTVLALVTAAGRIHFGATTASPGIMSGSGTPESAVAAPVGSLFLRTDGGAGTSLYVKETGTGNTGWVGK